MQTQKLSGSAAASSRRRLAAEFILLCLIIPTVIIVFRLAPYMFLFLWGACGVGWLIYRRYHYTDLHALWRFDAVNPANMRRMLVRWVICSACMLAFMYFYDPARLFYMVRLHPKFVPWLLVLYPVLSALPQGFIFCTFFFDRFAPFFKTDRAKIIASAIVFAYAHILFINFIAPVFSLFGGLIFAGTFARTRSLALVTIEHGLYGDTIFLIGLGWYFWAGAISLN